MVPLAMGTDTAKLASGDARKTTFVRTSLKGAGRSMGQSRSLISGWMEGAPR